MRFAKIAIDNTMPVSYYEGLHDRIITVPEDNGFEGDCAGYQVITSLLNTMLANYYHLNKIQNTTYSKN